MSLTRVKNIYWRSLTEVELRLRILTTHPLRVVLGAGGTSYSGWISTDIDTLNILNPGDWRRLFKPESITSMVAEHVWEHLTAAEGLLAAKNCFRYLRGEAKLRIAVPDGFHPDPNYINYVKVGCDGHQILYTHISITNMLINSGFTVEVLEYFDDHGEFHFQAWDPSDGMVERSMRFDSRNRDGKPNYTSLIVEATKPIDFQ